MRAVVFSGTADGRALCEWLVSEGAEVTVCVATDYGASLIDGADVHTGRLDKEGIGKVIADCDIVIDATHPYAEKVSENILSACTGCGKKLLRMLREEIPCGDAVYVGSVREAAEYLKNTVGAVFVSTGSKELHEFADIKDRVKARVLDTEEVRRKCGGLGMEGIMYKDPPFTYEENVKDFDGCGWLVTKDGGRAGGMTDKLRAARKLGMNVIIVRRPREKSKGYSYEEIKRYISGIGGVSKSEDKGGQPRQCSGGRAEQDNT